ncbi:hypothetical protein SDRG_08571 [Saprolegnia diclina VS20]|uniref:Uncharacterized protein n=1 Tax=Saprolegnia diclina (strain VS20) TaxID=1156394 RepID=T0QJG4_SAPDV|nr:hypothetical protein SDRG_08571 [Saprolegnia diclina VS20]EQC33890.1 hypothetical protein SDRG_08571 [Saprolegnia diclina VS20]|eukprot:XP_008612685.1 hypothetical protein SDRG_08571 [Saprolegnia diclina VS20]
MEATFRSAVLGQPEIASMVLAFQGGVYEDVRRAMSACNELVEFDAARGSYECDVSFGSAFAPNVSWPRDCHIFGFDTYALRRRQRDARLPLHLAIALGFVPLTKRLLRCRPDLGSEDAIVLAFVMDRLEICAYFLEQRAHVPEVYQRGIRRRTLGSVWYELFSCYLRRTLGRQDATVLVLLQRFGLRPEDFDEYDRRRAMRCATLANATVVLDLFPWFGYPCIMIDLAAQGFLPLVQSLHERGVACSTSAMDDAATYGHLDVVVFLHVNRTEGCTVFALDGAAANGHLDVVRFLHSNRREGCTVKAMDEAAANGHLEVVQFLHFNRTEGCTYKALDGAITKGHLDVVRFLIEQCIVAASFNSLSNAAANGHLAIVEYLHTLNSAGCLVAAIDNAALYGHFSVVKYLVAHCTEGSSGAVDCALDFGHLRVAEYFVSRGYPSPTSSQVLWDQATFQTSNMVDVLRFFLDNGGSWSATWMARASALNNVPLVAYLHAHPNTRCGPDVLESAIQNKAWGVVHFLAAHCTADVSLDALKQVLRGGHLEDVAHILQRQPQLRHDELLVVASSSHNTEAMRFLLAAKIGKPRKCLVEMAGRRQFVTESKFLLPYCMDATNHLDNIRFLLDLLALPDRRRATILQLITKELQEQGRMASRSLQLAPSVTARASTLRNAGGVVDWALALVICHLWAADGTTTLEQLEKKAALVQDAELQTQLRVLLASKRKRTGRKS